MKLRTFQAIRPEPEIVSEIVCPPYDVVDKAEAKKIIAQQNNSFMKVIRPDACFADDTNPYSEQVYQKSLQNYQQLLDEKKIFKDDENSLFLYSQTFNNHTQYGIVGLCHVQDYLDNVIKKHEVTRQDKEQDRIKLTKTIRANTGPVFLTYKNNTEIDAIVDKIKTTRPLYDVKSQDVEHKVWKIADYKKLLENFGKIPSAYIADGHHRSASAAKVCQELRNEAKNSSGDEDFNWFLCVLFPHNQLNILPYNRIIFDLNNLSEKEFLQKVAKVGKLKETQKSAPAKSGRLCFYTCGKWHELDFSEELKKNNPDMLDVEYLHEFVTKPILGIEDQRTSKRIEFIGGIKGTKFLKTRTDELSYENKNAVAFSLYPVSVEQLMQFSDNDKIMPPKSTWFEPKLLSGFFLHSF